MPMESPIWCEFAGRAGDLSREGRRHVSSAIAGERGFTNPGLCWGFNGDGKTDIAIAGQGSPAVSVLLAMAMAHSERRF